MEKQNFLFYKYEQIPFHSVSETRTKCIDWILKDHPGGNRLFKCAFSAMGWNTPASSQHGWVQARCRLREAIGRAKEITEPYVRRNNNNKQWRIKGLRGKNEECWVSDTLINVIVTGLETYRNREWTPTRARTEALREAGNWRLW